MKPDDLKSNTPDDGNTGGPDAVKEFAGALDNFGLTPRPKVKAQRVDPLLGMDLGGVTIVRLIGEGGMGRVYEAKQEKPSRSVAVKVIRAGITSEKTLRRFEREAEFLGRLQHPGIAQIFIVGTYTSDFGDVPFYVMEYLAEAKPVTNFAHEHGLSLGDKLRLFKQVCEAVAHGHDRGIVHRDLKPGNILVDAHGIPKVIDFGVARSTDSDLTLESMKTDTGQMIGTVQYMSPEQFGDNPDDLNCRADVYSLGVVLYELISGVPPYSVRKKALHEASRVVCEEVPTPLRSLDKTVPRDVSAIVERCLQKNRRHRYHSAGELAAEIGSFMAGKPVRAKPSGLFERLVTAGSFGPAINRRAGLAFALALGLGGAVSVDHMMGTGVSSTCLDMADVVFPRTAAIEASTAWTQSGLKITTGQCYRLTVVGVGREAPGSEFGPRGDAPAEFTPLTRLTTSQQIDDESEPADAYPRQMLLATVPDSNTVVPVGDGLTFIAPATGELAFRVNIGMPKDATDRVTGSFKVSLTRIRRPEFVDASGRTTITARINKPAWLLFRPDGLQWDYGNFMNATEAVQPTLINGVAWWPLPAKQDLQGWLEITQTGRTPVLTTSAFSWAAGRRGVKPVVENAASNPPRGSVTSEGPTPKTSGLKFSPPAEVEADLSCTISRPTPP